MNSIMILLSLISSSPAKKSPIEEPQISPHYIWLSQDAVYILKTVIYTLFWQVGLWRGISRIDRILKVTTSSQTYCHPIRSNGQIEG